MKSIATESQQLLEQVGDVGVQMVSSFRTCCGGSLHNLVCTLLQGPAASLASKICRAMPHMSLGI